MGYTLRIESQEKKNEKLAKVTMYERRKTIGNVQYSPDAILSLEEKRHM